MLKGFWQGIKTTHNESHLERQSVVEFIYSEYYKLCESVSVLELEEFLVSQFLTIGLDSFDIVELLFILEGEYNITIRDSFVCGDITVNQLIDYVVKKGGYNVSFFAKVC